MNIDFQPTLLSTSQISTYYGVHPQTIRRWDKLNLLTPLHRTFGNHRRYTLPTNEAGATVGYVRVSSADQKNDLLVQEQALITKSRDKEIVVDEIIKDIGAGMNYTKRGFKQLLNKLLTGKIKHLIIMHKDRLLRFGSDIIFAICKHMNVKVTILEESPFQSPIEQLCNDVLAMMTVFSSKIYGMRSHSNKSKTVNAQLCSAIMPTV